MATNPTLLDPAADPTLDPAPVPTPPAAPAPKAPPAADPKLDADPSPPANDDWRSRLSGGDEKLAGYLGRFASEKAFTEASKKLNDEIKGGVYRKPLSADPTEDELAAYRKDFGIPEKPEGYLEKLPEGLVIGDDDKPFIDAFVADMHSANAPKGTVDAAISAYYKILEDQSASEAEEIGNARRDNEEVLRSEWGGDFRRNLNIASGFIATLPDAVKGALTSGTDAAGMPLANNAEVLKWVTSLALSANPLATVVPGAGANQASAIAEEITAIETTMRTNRKAYNADAKMQERYRELVTAREKMKG